MINAYVMNEDEIVARIDNNEITIVNRERCPIYLLYRSDIESWIKSRTFDGTRTNLRMIKRFFKVSSLSNEELVLKVYAATITDRYWIKPYSEPDLKYEDVRYISNQLFTTALLGNMDVFSEMCSMKSPEFTNIGSLEKGWKNIDDTWYLYKNENETERFYEMFSESVSELMLIPSAHYEYDGELFRSKDFTNNGLFTLEHIDSLVGEETNDYVFCYNRIKEVAGEEIANQYVRLMYFDAVVRNGDRHHFNYGLLRENATGKFLSLAPNFDYNLVLFAQDVPDKIYVNSDVLIRDFIDLVKTADLNITFEEIDAEKLKANTSYLSQSPLYEKSIEFVVKRSQLIKEEFLKEMTPMVQKKSLMEQVRECADTSQSKMINIRINRDAR